MPRLLGNHDDSQDDLDDVRCDRWREIASARLDGEARRAEVVALDAHLEGCTACRVAVERIAAVTRTVRVRTAEAPVDLVGRVLAATAGGEPPVVVSVPAPLCDDAPDRLYLVGHATCGCAATCGCGCQDGKPCRCMEHAA